MITLPDIQAHNNFVLRESQRKQLWSRFSQRFAIYCMTHANTFNSRFRATHSLYRLLPTFIWLAATAQVHRISAHYDIKTRDWRVVLSCCPAARTPVRAVLWILTRPGQVYQLYLA